MRFFFKRRARRKIKPSRPGNKFRNACLSAALATAWGGSAEAADLQVSIAPTQTIQSARLVFQFANSSTSTFRLGTLSGGAVHTFNYYNIADSDLEPSTSGRLPAYEFIGTYSNAQTNGLSISFPNSLPIQQGQSFTDAFPPANGRSYAEADLIASLNDTNCCNYLSEEFVRGYASTLGTPYGQQSTLVNFSNATFGGTMNITIVPEPATWSVLVFAASTMIAFTRRRPAA